MRIKEPIERLKKLKQRQPMSKKESDDAAILAKKEKEKTRLVAYRAANSEKVKAAAAKYRNANREKLRMRAAKYYAANHEKVMEKHAAYRASKKAKAAATGDNHD